MFERLKHLLSKEKPIKRFLWEDDLKNMLSKQWKILAIVLITAMAIIIRVSGYSFGSGDYIYFLDQWMRFLKANGHFSGIKILVSDYGAPYLYVLSAISYLPEALFIYALKTFSCIFDFVCAIYVWKIVVKITKNEDLGLLAYGTVLFWPTVILNSGVWAQCDAIYTSLLLVMLWNFMEDKPKRAMIFFGLALSLKLQAVFILPFLILLYLYEKWSLLQILYAIATFVLINVPSWFMGLPITHFIKVYIAQTDAYNYAVTMNAPTVYAFLPTTSEYYEKILTSVGTTLVRLGICFAMALLIFLAIFVLKERRKLSNETLILLLLFCALVVPYFLPRMHERYFFVADVVAIIYIFIKPKRWWLGILVTFPSCITYAYYLFLKEKVPGVFGLQFMAVIMGIGVICVVKWLIESILTSEKKVEIPVDVE